MRTRSRAGWIARLLALGLLLAGLATAGAEESGPVLVGYIKKLQPDRTGGDRELAVEGARITMKGTGSWVETDAQGLFRLQLVRSTRIGQSIEVELAGVPGWLLYQPADSRVVVPEPSQTVTLRLLPKGSLRFLESRGLASLLSRMMSEAKESLRTAPVLPPGSPPPPPDLKGPMQKWASEYGLSLEQVQTAVDTWAKEVLQRRQHDDEQLCLAHYSQKQLEQAAACFESLARTDVQALQRLHTQLLEHTERAVRRFEKAAEAHALRYDFTAALREYEQAAPLAKRDLSPVLWAEVQVWLGITHCELGIRVDGDSSRTHLAQAVLAHRSAQEVYTKTALPQDWAMTQNNLGLVLREQALRLEEPASAMLLSQAVTAYRSALEVSTKTDLPEVWATTQNNLGNALSDQASRTEGPAGVALLSQAVAAYRSALEVRTKTDLPQGWAMTQNNLGIALRIQASRTEGPAGVALLSQAVTAYRSALEVRTKRDLPEEWAATQNNLGVALRNQADRTAGPAGTALLAQAVAAYRSALGVRTKVALPQDWAMTQNNLGVALQCQAQRLAADSPARKALLADAQAAFRAALTIHTQAAFPLDWAKAQRNLAAACALVPDEGCAAEGFANVLRVYPDWSEMYTEAYVRYHERLFRFAEAHALNQAWLAHRPNDRAVWSNLVESSLTTGRLAEVGTLLAEGLTGLSPGEQVALLALGVVALQGQGKVAEAASQRSALRALVAAQPADFRVTWTFTGTRHFLQTAPHFAPHRPPLLALLTALEQPNRTTILTALDTCCRATHPAK